MHINANVNCAPYINNALGQTDYCIIGFVRLILDFENALNIPISNNSSTQCVWIDS